MNTRFLFIEYIQEIDDIPSMLGRSYWLHRQKLYIGFNDYKCKKYMQVMDGVVIESNEVKEATEICRRS